MSTLYNKFNEPWKKNHTGVRKSVFVVSFYNSLLIGSKAFVPARKEIKVHLKRPKYNLKVNLENLDLKKHIVVGI